MSDTPTHAQVLAAIDKARDIGHGDDCERATYLLDRCDCEHHERGTHCDDLRATAERHAPLPPSPYCPWCSHGQGLLSWPCAEVRQVIDRLTGWGVLGDEPDDPGAWSAIGAYE